ncbi:hypothetical protein [Serratia fonticola]|uniref:hypothetical protein n=1 Tax=Serratia fonticola TaxID=47917 RepID=UPI002179921E|nr:hypothetical protein [Serratia fonticola]CAI1939488.1 Uncharacterised protein [Serratia fonticola]
MKMKIKLVLLLMMAAVVALSVGYWVWEADDPDSQFECRSRVYSKLIDNACNKSSTVDVFLSLQGDGEGYLLVSGTHSCPQTPLVELESIVNFTYSRKGGYYSIHLGQRNPAVIELFDALKDDNIKVKFTKVDDNNYIVSSPIETLMVCTTN